MIETWRTDRFLSYMICDNNIFILLLSVGFEVVCLEFYGTVFNTLNLHKEKRNIMSDHVRKIFHLEQDLQNGFRSHECLSKLAYELKNTSSTKIELDLKGVNFIASNLFSVLGCIFFEYMKRNPESDALYISGIKMPIKEIIQKNGFWVHLGLEKLPDVHNTVIPYKYFKVDQIEEYERYLTLNLFTGKVGEVLPCMPAKVSDEISDSLLELFKNISDHTTSSYVFTCGQYFPRSSMLFFTIVDAGETIAYNVNRYHDLHGLVQPDNPLQWAIRDGNTTALDEKPRGIGLTIIRDFILSTKGTFYIFSNYDTFEIHQTKERFKKLSAPFPGTAVTIGFNLPEISNFYSNANNYETIQF